MKGLIIHLFMATSIIFLFAKCNKDDGEIDNTDNFKTYIQGEMEDQNIPALSVLIFKEDNIIYEDYQGNSQVQQNIALENDHLFLLASISKVVTATALLQLYEDGLFSLDDKINDHLPFDVSIPNHNNDITFRMLLTHTAAIADGDALDGQYYYGQDSPVELDFFLENYLTPNGGFYNATQNFYDFNPGNKHEYSNTGNALIGLLVEKVSGKNFNEYCKQNIFTPLGMTNTAWRLDEISQTKVQPYNYINGQYEAIDHYTFTDYPNGGLRSTGRDMFRFLSVFVLGGNSNNHQLLEAATINDMITPQIPALDNGVGLHLFLMNPDNNLWGHDGEEQGVATIMGFNPTTKIGAIILSNQGDADLEEILEESYKFGLGL